MKDKTTGYNTYREIQKGLSLIGLFVPHILPIKRSWMDMIAALEKKEEYREDSPYWQTRILDTWRDEAPEETFILRAGYTKDSPALLIDARPVRRSGGRAEWGADPEKTYITLVIGKVWTVDAEGNITILGGAA